MMIKKFTAVLLAALLIGCSLTPTTPAPIQVYDLGPAPITAPGTLSLSQTFVRIMEIAAPIWLDTQAIQYRLAYHDPARIYTYANSRWTAPPAQLLTEHFRRYLASHGTDGPNNDKRQTTRPPTQYLLKIELSEFAQIFSTQNNSHAVIQLRAALYEPDARLPVALHSFTMTHPTKTADAAGAVAAFILASDNLLGELVQWLAAIHHDR